MSKFWNFAFATILVLIWIVAGGYVTQANVKIGSQRDNNEDLSRAYWATFWAAFITWTLIGLAILAAIIILTIGFFTGGDEAALAEGEEGITESVTSSESKGGGKGFSKFFSKSKGGNGMGKVITIISYGLLILALFLAGLTGVLASIGAVSINRSVDRDPSQLPSDLQKARLNCIIAASLTLGSVGLIFIGLIVFFIAHYEGEKAEKKKLAEAGAKE